MKLGRFAASFYAYAGVKFGRGSYASFRDTLGQMGPSKASAPISAFWRTEESESTAPLGRAWLCSSVARHSELLTLLHLPVNTFLPSGHPVTTAIKIEQMKNPRRPSGRFRWWTIRYGKLHISPSAPCFIYKYCTPF